MYFVINRPHQHLLTQSGFLLNPEILSILAGPELEDEADGVEEEAGSGWSDPSLSVTDGSGHFVQSLQYIIVPGHQQEDQEEGDLEDVEEGLQSSQLEEELFLVDSEEEYQEQEEEDEMTTTLFPPDRLCVERLARPQLCDSLPDCPAGEDEADCQFGQCRPGEFSCLSGRCIPSHWTCDGRPDCQTGEDEVRQELVVIYSVTVSPYHSVALSQCHRITVS